jgi:cytochrome c oxidase assembly factor CtaG
LQLYEDDPAVHVTQHMLVMMAVAPLLALGAPLTLLLRSLPIQARRLVVRELRGSSLRVFGGRFAALILAVDYYLTMYVYELTPLRSLAERHGLVHAAVHLYFLLCGILFWLPVAGVDPVRLRPSPRVKAAMVAIGLPAFAVLGTIELERGQSATGWAYVISGAAMTFLGLALLGASKRLGADSRLRRPGSWARGDVRDGPPYREAPAEKLTSNVGSEVG